MNISNAFLATLVLSLSATLAAQTDNNNQDLDPIVVTASRAPIELDRVLQSITIITREQIEQRQAVHVGDLLRDVPGFSVSRSGGVGTQTQVRVRGAEANQLLVLIDGVEANDPASGDEFRFEFLTTADIERIEILRGPQSALWGTDALAGVINIITRSGSRDNPGANGSIFIEGGSNATINAGGHLNFAADAIRGNLGISRFETDGNNISRIGDEQDGSENTTFSGKLNADLGSNAGLEAVLRHTNAETDIDTIDFAVTGLPADADQHNEATRTYAKLSGFLNSLGGRLTQSAALSYQDTDNDNFTDNIETTSTASDKFSIRYQIDYQITSDHRLTGAVDHEDVDFSQRGTATAFGDPNQDQSIDTTGLVLEYIGHAAAWDWNLGLRRDIFSDFNDATSYQAAVGYNLLDMGRFRAAYGEGQKAPTFTERFGFFADTFVGNPNLDPEESESFELGYEHSFDRGSASLTWFNQNLTNEINGFVFDPDLGVFTAANENGTSKRNGIEFATSWRLGSGFTATGNYTYTDATEPDGAQRVREVRRPRHVAHFNLNYSGNNARTNINLNVSYNGTRTDLFFPPFPEPSQRLELGSFVLVDLTGNWRVTENLDLFARVNNLLDEDYEEVVGFATPGITAFAGIRYHFGR